MKKKLFCLLLLFILPVCLLFTGCAENIETKSKENNTISESSEFVCVNYFYPDYSDYFYVIVHKKTKIMYLAQNNGGMTVIVDKEGKPLIYEGEL